MNDRNYRRLFSILSSLLLIAIITASCDGGGILRNNERDPNGINFTPTPIENLAAIRRGLYVDLTWHDRSNFEDGYVVERSIDGRPFTLLSHLPRNTGAYRDTLYGPLFGATYRVAPFVIVNDSQRSEFSATVTVSLVDQFPTVSLEIVDERNIRFRWTAPAPRDQYLIHIERLVGYDFETIASVDMANRQYVYQYGFDPGTEQRFRFRSSYDGYVSEPFGGHSIRMRAPTPGDVRLSTGSRVILEWAASPQHVRWFIERCTGDPHVCDVEEMPRNDSYMQTYTDLTANRDNVYQYRVRSYTSDFSRPIQVFHDGSAWQFRIIP